VNGRGGAVAIIQRFGAALNLNVHVHALVLDGVHAEDDGSGTLQFHPATSPSDEEMNALLGTIKRRIVRLLARRGVTEGGEHAPDRWSGEAPVLPRDRRRVGAGPGGVRAARRGRGTAPWRLP